MNEAISSFLRVANLWKHSESTLERYKKLADFFYDEALKASTAEEIQKHRTAWESAHDSAEEYATTFAEDVKRLKTATSDLVDRAKKEGLPIESLFKFWFFVDNNRMEEAKAAFPDLFAKLNVLLTEKEKPNRNRVKKLSPPTDPELFKLWQELRKESGTRPDTKIAESFDAKHGRKNLDRLQAERTRGKISDWKQIETD